MFFQSEWLSSAMDARLLVWLVLQVTLVAMVTYSVVVLAGRATPASRAVVCLLGLGCMTALPIASLLQFYEWSWGQWLQAPRSIAATTVVEQSPQLRPAVDTLSVQVQPLPWWQEKLLVVGGLFSDVGYSEPGTAEARSSEAGSSTMPSTPLASSAFIYWLPAVLACGVTLGAGRLLLGLWLVRRLRNASVPLDDPQLEAELDHCARQMGMAAGVPLAISHEIGTPAVVGWRTPLLLLPTTWRTWTAEERQAVLAHELAHIQRGDYMLTAVAQAAVALHFFHPLAHALVSRLRLDQELAADGLAANLVGGSQRYVEILAGLALRQPAARTPGPAQAFLPPRRMFVRRLEMLRSQNFGDRAWSRLYASAASCAVVALTLVASGLRPIAATAQETLTKQQPVATTEVSIEEILSKAYGHAIAVRSFEVDIELKESTGRLSDLRIVRDGQKTYFDIHDHKVGILAPGVFSSPETTVVDDGLLQLHYKKTSKEIRQVNAPPVEIVSTMVSSFYWLSIIELRNLGDTGFQNRALWDGLSETGELQEQTDKSIVSIKFPCEKNSELSVVVDFNRELDWFPVAFRLFRNAEQVQNFTCEAVWLDDERGERIVYPVRTKTVGQFSESHVTEMAVDLDTLKLNPTIPDSQFTSEALPRVSDELDE